MNAFKKKRRSVKSFLRLLIWLLPVSLLTTLLIFASSGQFNNNLINSKLEFQAQCKDWNDYKFIEAERRRKGPGEHGEKVELTDPVEIELNDVLYKETGFSVVISNKISVNRSTHDTRDRQCKRKKYLARLQKVSVVIIFRNEVMSVLLRTIHGVINRTPADLLHEIILVNDNSTNAELYEPLQNYVNRNFYGKVKIKNLSERKGLIVTRLEGARVATGEVLVFFDSHVEVGTNWLPPLLDPIVRNRRIATMPVIDDFSAEDFSMYGNKKFGNRGAFDWHLVYHTFDRYLPEDVDPLEPFPNPIMLGCAFAIDRKFFLDELGGYDEGFMIWNAENYELSFKLWLCADGLYEVPCSRVTHSFRMINPSRYRDDDFVGRNFKRLVEVWFDEYKELVYGRDRKRYKHIDPGDLSQPKAVREKLDCKPFQYFMEVIAPDFATRYPMVEDSPVFASGQIKSLGFPYHCIDTLHRDEFQTIGLFPCQDLDSNGKSSSTQFFRLNFLKNIAHGFAAYCLDAYQLSIPQCSYFKYGNQIWRFYPETRLIRNGGGDGNDCLKANADERNLSLEKCDESDFSQKWKFTYENKTALEDWENIYGYQKFVYGDKEINREKFLPLDYEYC